jgi:DNA-3-methyladenine glycosylase II
MYAHAKAHFKKHDHILYQAALEHDIPDLVASPELFRDIVWTIIGQQLSGKAADAIFARFKTLFADGVITPAAILALAEEDLRAAGLSGAKARAIRALAQSVSEGALDVAALPSLDDSAIITALTQVKGIGPWTAEMLLMFSLGRPDVFSRGDLGLRKGIMRLYGLRTFPSEKRLAAITSNWSPYRTYAARILWRVADEAKRTGRKRPE